MIGVSFDKNAPPYTSKQFILFTSNWTAISEIITDMAVMVITGIIVTEETDKRLETAEQSNTATTIVAGTDLRPKPITIAIDENPPAIALINKVEQLILLL